MTFEHVHKRRGFWYYIRRVPKPALHLEPRPIVAKSTGIRVADDPRGIVARQRVLELDTAQTLKWDDLIAGRNPELRHDYRRNVHIANTHHLPYRDKQEVAALPDGDFMHRLDVIRANPTPEVASAMMGTVPKPQLMLSALIDEYAKLNAASLKSKSANQYKKWRVARDARLKTFIEVIGHDIELANVKRTHVLQLRNHWNDLAAKDELKIESANKYLGNVSAMFKAVAEAHQLETGTIFQKIYIKGGKTGKRHSFDNAWVQNTLFAEGALDGLNQEARSIIYLIVETGIRLVEACSLNKSAIVLDHDIPHIKIRADGRELKTDQSERDIPLVGVALMAMQQNPNGFPRYLDKNPQASGLINQYLKTHFELKPKQSVYSLRHTFKNRLRSIRCQDEISARLMGHEYELPEYGEPSLEDKLYWLNKIAFRPPSRI
jgi:integrase